LQSRKVVHHSSCLRAEHLEMQVAPLAEPEEQLAQQVVEPPLAQVQQLPVQVASAARLQVRVSSEVV
jgi:hypothetical protein